MNNIERFITVVFHPLVFHHNIISFVSIELNLLEKKVAENLNDITLTTIKFIERCRITNSSIYGNNLLPNKYLNNEMVAFDCVTIRTKKKSEFDDAKMKQFKLGKLKICQLPRLARPLSLPINTFMENAKGYV